MADAAGKVKLRFFRLKRSESRCLNESGRFAAGANWISSGMALASESENSVLQARGRHTLRTPEQMPHKIQHTTAAKRHF
jgi:hypothetical protein